MAPWFLLLSLGLLGVYSAPTSLTDRETPATIGGPDTAGTCTSIQYDVYDVSPPWDDVPKLTSGAQCVSPCGQGTSYTHTTTVTSGFDIGFGGGPGSDLTKIFTAAVSAGFSKSWSTSDSTTHSTTVDCPGKGYTCGMQAISKMVTTKGRQWDSKCSDNTLGGSMFRVDAPATVAGSSDAIVKFQTCIFQKPDGAKPSDYAGYVDCPTVGGGGS